MPKNSAGLLMCRKRNNQLEFFLVHPGGPFWAKKNEGAWSIPKGEPEEREELLHAAQREFLEETGLIPQPPFYSLGSCKTKSGKTIYAWAFMGEWDPAQGIKSNAISIEWPPKSGKQLTIQEIDRAAWMTWEKAFKMTNSSQIPFLERARHIFATEEPIK